MGLKKFDRKKAQVIQNGRLMIDELVDRDKITPDFVSLWGRIAPGAESDDERHEQEELNIVFSGSITIEVGDTAYDAVPGDVVSIPSNARHKVVNRTKEEGVWICVLWKGHGR